MKTKRIITETDVINFFNNSINTIEDAMGTLHLNKNTKEIVFDFNAALLLSLDGLYAEVPYKYEKHIRDKEFIKILEKCLTLEVKRDSELKYSKLINGKTLNFMV